MERSKGKGIKYKVSLAPRCSKEYKKLAKKSDPNLMDAIEKEIDRLETDPKAGKEMERDLDGLRSIRIDKYAFRIVYEIMGSNVQIHAIGHRKNVYDDMRRRWHGLGHSDGA